ncbi:hypothetical protein LJC33_01515 [Eubacteriales bacterium OttesenSCG-928-N13]|nr:hypothetical protein [Eubacteriales bacterium OttesenSCG-928-N13]
MDNLLNSQLSTTENVENGIKTPVLRLLLWISLWTMWIIWPVSGDTNICMHQNGVNPAKKQSVFA